MARRDRVAGGCPRLAGCGDFTSRADLAAKITSFAVRCNHAARPWTWTYAARADHQRYCARHSGQHATAGPATAQALPQAA